MRHSTALTKLQQASCNMDMTRNTEKPDNFGRNNGRKASNVNNIRESRSSSLPSLPPTASRTPTALKAMPTRHQKQPRTSQSCSSSSSTTTIGDAPNSIFCFTSNHTTTQCPDIPPQRHAEITTAREANLPKLTRHTQWIQPNGFQGRSPPWSCTSTPETIQSAISADKCTPARQKSPWKSRTFPNASRTQSQRKTKSKGPTVGSPRNETPST